MLKKLITCIAATGLLLSSLVPALAADIDIGGELSQSLTYDSDNRQFAEAKAEYSLRLEREFGLSGRAYLSLRGGYNAITATHAIVLDEAWASAYLENTDVTVGKQVISWGTADGINPTNTINPAGISLTDSKLKGEPILAAQATYYGDGFDLTGVVVPAFVPLDISDLLSFIPDAKMREALSSVPLPATSAANMEWAVRFGTYLAGYDLRLSYHHGWEDIPAMTLRFNIDPGTMQPAPGSLSYEGRYRRVDVIGLATAGVMGDFGVWAEAAYVIPEKLSLNTVSPLEVKQLLSPNEPYLQAVVGADHTFDSGVYAEAQYIYYGNGQITAPYSSHPGTKVDPGNYVMSRLSYDFDMSNKVELIGIVSLNDGSAVVMPTYTRYLTQMTQLKLGVAAFVGSSGEFSSYPTQIIVGLSTSF
jgi:hypothetical protein